MTREEAKQWLEAMKSSYALPTETYEALDTAVAIDKAIEALQTDLDICPYYHHELTGEPFCEMEDRRHGTWKDIDNYHRTAICSHCRKVTMFEKWGERTKPYDYCPNCGAKMDGERSEE